MKFNFQILFRLLFPILYFLFSLSSCSFFNEKDESKNAIARVYDKYLYKKDLQDIIPHHISYQDSITVQKDYIESWIRQNVVLKKAESNITQDAELSRTIDKQLADYHNSLITFSYEKELINQKLDTMVNDAEIEKYYNGNKNNFELKDNIMKVLYLKLKKNSPKLNNVRQWYKSENPRDRRLLETYCHQYAVNYFLDDNTWLLFDDLLKEIPIKTYDKEQYLQNNRFIEIEDGTYLYLVNIKGFKIKDSVSPLSFEKNNIRNIILNKRKLLLIDEMEKNSYEEAKRNNDFVIF